MVGEGQAVEVNGKNQNKMPNPYYVRQIDDTGVKGVLWSFSLGFWSFATPTCCNSIGNIYYGFFFPITLLWSQYPDWIEIHRLWRKREIEDIRDLALDS